MVPALAGEAAAEEEKRLTVYTYDAFTSDWGPGPRIKEAFEAECGCVLDFVAIDTSGGVLSRLRLEGETSKADVILGLDLNLMAEAEATGLLAPHGVAAEDLTLPIDWNDETFLPFDYGYFAFVYDTEALAQPPRSLRELVEAPDDLKIILQDPRTSTPGLGVMLWVRAVYGEDAPEAWARLARKTVTTTKGWRYSRRQVAERAPIVRPWKPRMAATIFLRPVTRRAILRAPSTASVPELQRNARSSPGGVISASFASSSARRSL
nr:thiamine ABC transporter substrate-binding protein [Anaerolineae bacterium]